MKLPKKVRLEKRTLKGLFQAFETLRCFKGVEIYLFGSRTDPNVKGGDIDLLVLVPKNWNSQERFDLKIKLLKEIYKRLGERRIDLLIFPKGSKEAEKFLRGAVKLWNT